MGNIVFAEVVGTIFYTFLGLGLLVACWLLIERITPLSLRKELEEDQNTAIAIVIGSLFVSLAIIIAAVILS
ncbi:DUF350 domain-containing protein [Marinibacterium profundimaris]|uniref:DUF350 domain-containing protein n=1 Tax=Marinibacterium profundimaris TaxID=1679460 RepID=A0A225NFU8_9RHOB|nr:DUF350 domain-containing protein [Marinibacterium profundimaris]OWU72267.1 hypothetical protein ATO3_17085 [Marinibacterium profundimaris]